MTALLPPNVKVHLALGYIDMRKGIDGLAMLASCTRIHLPDICLSSEVAPGPTLSRSSTGMAPASACSQNGSSTASFCGHRALRLAKRCR